MNQPAAPQTVVKITFDGTRYSIFAPVKYLAGHRLRVIEKDGTGYFGGADTLDEARRVADSAFKSILSQVAMERDWRSFHAVSEADCGHLGEWTSQQDPAGTVQIAGRTVGQATVEPAISRQQ
jgi:hypothetical protein